MARNFHKINGISIHLFFSLGSSSVQSTQDAEKNMFFILFSISGVLWTELEPNNIKGSIEMPLWFLLKLPTITIVSSCSCYWHKSFFSSKSINNVVKSSFQSFLDLGGRGGAVCEVEWIREVKSLKSSSSSGRGNLALEMVPWWERWWKKCDWKKRILRNTVCVYSLQWENGYGTCTSRTKQVSTKVNEWWDLWKTQANTIPWQGSRRSYSGRHLSGRAGS